ncbi:MAG: hypothetical protein GY950_35695 [bacterium]|nr:hypothetical protein [bacterium]
MNGTVAVYWKSPNKTRTDIEIPGMGFKMAQAYDGKTAWINNPMMGGVMEMPEKNAVAFKRQAMGSDALLNPKKYGITYTFKGKEKIEEKEYLLMERAYADGHKTMLYVDSKTYLVYKVKTTTFNQMQKEVPSEIFSTDYKKVGKIMIAHTVTVFQEGREFVKMTFDKVSNNSGVDASLFTMPKK